MFEVIIGIEIHLELNTKTKMFSGAIINFDANPNTNVSTIDIAYPGTLPLVNKEAVTRAIKLAKALNMEIDNELRFDRKNYFYPDLPKGFQITQQFHPIGKNGKLSIFVQNSTKCVEIERIHLEEDTARQYHKNEDTFLDYNRAGIPLIEIVTKPVINSADEAVKYVETIRQIALSQNISDAKMEQGSLRADINLSLRPYKSEVFGTKVEIKNINTISNIRTAINNEIETQTKQLLRNETILQQTKRFDESTQTNIPMRTKTGDVDYKYFREPNIPTVYLDEKFINSVLLNELPWEKEKRYRSGNINEIYLNRLLNDYVLADLFDQIQYDDLDKKAKIFFNEFVAYANTQNLHLAQMNFKASDVVEAITYLDQGVISGKQFKILVPLLNNNNDKVIDLIKQNNLMQISDRNLLLEFINPLITDIIKKEYEENRERTIRSLIGQVMKVSKAKANPIMTTNIIKELLGND